MSVMLRKGWTYVARPLAAAAQRAVTVRSFHATVPVKITYEEWVQSASPSYHQTIQKKWYPRAANGTMLTGDGDWAGGIVGLERNPDVVKDLTSLCEYMLEVLKTMPESDYRSSVEKRTNFKLKVLRSGVSEEEMIEKLDFGPLEEVMATVRGELELIKRLGKDFF